MRRETRRLQAENPSTIAGESYILCPDVSRLKIQYYDHKLKEWVNEWSTLNASGNQYLPTHVRITLTVIDERGPGGLVHHRRAHPDDREGRLQAGEAVTVFARLRRWAAERRRLRAQQPLSRKQRGVAMLIVLTWLALMISVIGEFTYGTTVDAAQAANARDELRAHYLARSSVSLSRLLIKIQQQFIDPVMGQVQKMLQSAMGSSSSTTGTAGNTPQHATQPRVLAARDRLRQHADGVLQRVEGRGGRPRQPHRPRHQQHQGAGAQVRRPSTPRSPPRTERSTSTAARAWPPTETSR